MPLNRADSIKLVQNTPYRRLKNTPKIKVEGFPLQKKYEGDTLCFYNNTNLINNMYQVMERNIFLLFFLWISLLSYSQSSSVFQSKAWISDLGNGHYRNPVLFAEYSDPDVCRVGKDYYMTVSSFNCVPGLPILHSNDLVNWSIVGHALDKLIPEDHFKIPRHGEGVWAPSIRYHKGEFYIYYGDPDFGIYMTKSKSAEGPWEPLKMVMKGKGLIDPCPLFDGDDIYMAYAFAGSRIGIKSLLAVVKLTEDGTKTAEKPRIIYDGHDLDPTIEGPKLYKRNGYYYIFAPAGGVSTGWQVALRSKDIFGPYERRVVMAQGQTSVNGPHQGAWLNTPDGEDWFLHFQDVGTFGRVIHLQPMVWKNDWPVIGEDLQNSGCGQPVLSYKKPSTDKIYAITTPIDSDSFEANKLGLQWQWNANPETWWHFANPTQKCLSLFSVPLPDEYISLWDIPNLLLQKIPAPGIVVSMKLAFKPSPIQHGERTGLVVMGLDYALLSLENTPEGFLLSQVTCLKADRKGKETINESLLIKESDIYLRVSIDREGKCNFYYSKDNKKYKMLGHSFTAKKGRWIGARIGTFCSRPTRTNDGGRVDLYWIQIDKL